MIKNLPSYCLLGSLHITTVNIMLILPDPRSALLRAKFRLDNIQQDSVRSRNCLAGLFYLQKSIILINTNNVLLCKSNDV